MQDPVFTRKRIGLKLYGGGQYTYRIIAGASDYKISIRNYSRPLENRAHIVVGRFVRLFRGRAGAEVQNVLGDR